MNIETERNNTVKFTLDPKVININFPNTRDTIIIHCTNGKVLELVAHGPWAFSMDMNKPTPWFDKNNNNVPYYKADILSMLENTDNTIEKVECRNIHSEEILEAISEQVLDIIK